MHHNVHPFEMLRKITNIDRKIASITSTKIFGGTNYVKSIRHCSKERVKSI